jgi:hypothetical protein
MNHSNVERGIRTRRALLAVARTCHAKGQLLPSYSMLGRAVGLSNAQITRHMNILYDERALTVSLVGRRFRIESIRS